MTKRLFSEKATTLLKNLGALIQHYEKCDFCVVAIFGDNEFE